MKDKIKTSDLNSKVVRNSTDFYERNLYSDKTDKKSLKTTLNKTVNATVLNKIYKHSSEAMTELPDNCVHLMITSPPYNVGKEYDDDLTEKEYRQSLKKTWQETYRVLVDSGRACINVANLGRKPYLPLHSWIIEDMTAIGFKMRGEIIWQKSTSAGVSCAWGSWLSPSNPVIRDTHEYILIFTKKNFKHQSKTGQSTIKKEDFVQWTKSVWNISAESAKKIKHPAPFPLELPQRLIHLYSYTNDIVLDPFMGSGTTAVAAKQTNRNWVGYEIHQKYIDIAQQRIYT